MLENERNAYVTRCRSVCSSVGRCSGIVALLLVVGGTVAGAANPESSTSGERVVDRSSSLSSAGAIHPALTQVPEDPKLPRVLLIGDSISMGYTLPLREQLKSKANVQHPPENCGSSRRILERIDQYLGSKPWHVIHFNSGIHDLTLLNHAGAATNSKLGGKAQVPLEEYRANLEKIISRLKQTGAVLIWCTTTPIGKSARFRQADDVDRYNKVAKEVMQQHGIRITDLHRQVLKRSNSGLTPDGVHFTPDGYRELADDLAPAIEKALAEKPK